MQNHWIKKKNESCVVTEKEIGEINIPSQIVIDTEGIKFTSDVLMEMKRNADGIKVKTAPDQITVKANFDAKTVNTLLAYFGHDSSDI